MRTFPMLNRTMQSGQAARETGSAGICTTKGPKDTQAVPSEAMPRLAFLFVPFVSFAANSNAPQRFRFDVGF